MAELPRLAIYGIGGLGREVFDIIADLNRKKPTWDVIGWLDDGDHAGQTVRGLPILGGADWLATDPSVTIAIALGSPQIRLRLSRLVLAAKHPWATIVSPAAHLGGNIAIGEGSIIMPGAVLTSDVQVGRGALINVNCVAAHDTRLGDFATLAPLAGLMGAAVADEGANLGGGAIVLPSVTAGAWSILGAGAVLTESNPPNTTVVGVPARVIKTRPEGWHKAD